MISTSVTFHFYVKSSSGVKLGLKIGKTSSKITSTNDPITLFFWYVADSVYVKMGAEF